MRNVLGHSIKTPQMIWQGRGSATIVAARVSAYGIQRPFVVIDPVVRATKYGQKILSSIKQEYNSFPLWDEIDTNAPRYQVEGAAREMKKKQADGVIVIGGGSSIDLAKVAALLSVNEKPLELFWENNPSADIVLPIFAVPTTCGTGSETTPFAVILDQKNRRKRGLENNNFIPQEVFLDSNFLLTLPCNLIAATAIDALCHAIESYVSVKATSLTRCSASGTIVTITQNIRAAALHHNIEALARLLSASANARLLYPRTGLTVAHAMSHPLGAYFGIHHGEAVARTIISSIEFNVEERTALSLYAEIAQIMGVAPKGVTQAKAIQILIHWFTEIFDELRIPVNRSLSYEKIGSIDSVVREMAEITMLSSNIPSNPRKVTIEDVINIFYKILRG